MPARGSSLVSRDILDKVALVVAFLAGSAGSWAIKFLGFGPFLAAGWTIGAMLSYVAAVALLGRLRIEPEAIGDNCYYLGFLLTLASLSATLYQLAQSQEQTELMRSIVSGFGIALVSTILGILLRVIFVQLRPDIVARDRETRIELQQAARELRLELATSVATIKQFSTEAIQLASEQGVRISDATSAVVEAQRARMESDIETYAAMLRKTLDEAGAQSVRTIGDGVTHAATDAQASIRDSLDRLGNAIGSFAAAQSAALDARVIDAAGAMAIGEAAIARAAIFADEIDLVGARVGAALASICDGLDRTAASIEAAGIRIQGAEAAATAARDAAEHAAQHATLAARQPRTPGWWPFRGRR